MSKIDVEVAKYLLGDPSAFDPPQGSDSKFLALTPHRIPLYFTGTTPENALCGLAWDDAEQAAESLLDLDPEDREGQKVFSFWTYIDPESAEVVA